MKMIKDRKIQDDGDRITAIFSVGGTYISCEKAKRKFHAIS